MKKRLLAFIFSCLLFVQLFTTPVFAAENQPASPTAETRSSDESAKLKEIYAYLFPDAYHYIEEYEIYGISDEEDITTIYSEYKDYGNKTYGLIVMSDGQIFANITEYSNTPNTRAANANGTATLQVGDFGHYLTFRCTYEMNYSGYDKINTCDVVGSSGGGWLYYGVNLKKKYNEDANGPAYHIYTNSSMEYQGNSKIYDIGVAVGRDQVKGVGIPATGLDMFLWALFNSIFSH